MRIRLDSPDTKISHLTSDGEEKTLSQHIMEIKEISSIILDKHFSKCKKYREIVNILAEKHDVGKLNPQWNIYDKRKPPHSALSAYLYLIDNEKYDPMLFYLIWKHHSSLRAPPTVPTKIQENFLRFLKHPDIKVDRVLHKRVYQIIKNEILKRTKKEENYYENVLYSDLFGVFKTADILSAKFEVNLKALNESPVYSEEEIKNLLKSYVESKGLKFNENKWKEWIKMADTKNLILLAPTGWGKTFAAVTIALASKPSHIIYVLPTITAIRKMKETLKALFGDIEIEENYFFADIEIIKGVESKNLDENPPTEIFVAKTFLAPMTVTTLDQILLSFLNVGKYHMKRYHFRNSFIILDEYHLYPLNGLILLLKILKKFNEEFGYNIRCLFMSATEEPTYTSLITHNIKEIKKYEFLEEYKKLRRYNYTLLEKDILDDDVIKIIKEHSLKCGKTLIILNTVEKAIKMYLKLRDLPTNVLLLHSRFIYQDRRKKEELLERYNKSDEPVIFIATQVAEVSLDMSFDYLFTEVAPIPSLIQRFGRVNRYNSYTEKVNVFITKVMDISGRYPYDEESINKSWNILEKHLMTGNIKDEYALLSHILNGELKIKIDEGAVEVDRYFNKWIRDTNFIYTVDLNDDEMNRILKFRDTSTTLIVPGCKEKILLDILSKDSKIKNILIKDLLVPVPIWWLYEERDFIQNVKGIIVLGGERFLYSPSVGYFDTKRISVPEDIPLCHSHDAFIY